MTRRRWVKVKNDKPLILARSIPPRIARAVAGMELAGSDLVNRKAILMAIESLNGEPLRAIQKLDAIIRQLSDAGWLLPTKTRGWWEFAPGSRAGSFPSNNSFLPLIANLTKRSDSQIAVTMESAAFIHRLSEHPPHKEVIAVPPGTSRKGALNNYRHVNLQLPVYATMEIDGIPVHSIAGLLAAMAIRPLAYRDWPNVKNWLPKACDQLVNLAKGETGSLAGKEGLLQILNGRATSAFARAAYFFRIADQTVAAEKIMNKIPSDLKGPIYLGPRDSLGSKAKYDLVTKVYDSLIDNK